MSWNHLGAENTMRNGPNIKKCLFSWQSWFVALASALPSKAVALRIPENPSSSSWNCNPDGIFFHPGFLTKPIKFLMPRRSVVPHKSNSALGHRVEALSMWDKKGSHPKCSWDLNTRLTRAVLNPPTGFQLFQLLGWKKGPLAGEKLLANLPPPTLGSWQTLCPSVFPVWAAPGLNLWTKIPWLPC